METGAFCDDLGSIPLGTTTKWDASHFMRTKDLVSAFQGFARVHGVRQKTVTESDLKQAIEKLCPSAVYKREKKDSNQARGHRLPALVVARHEFAAFMNVDIEWSL